MECFTVYADEIEGRIDPSPYHPIRLNTIKKIKSCGYHFLLLKEVIEFKRRVVTTKTENEIYIGLENIESDTGDYVSSKEQKEKFGSAFKFEKGDILFPKLRPYLNKVYLAKFDGVCSTEFYVLKAKKCDSSYLFAFLNSKLVVNQTSYLMTGNTLPRLQTEEVERLIIPVPEEKIQHNITQLMESAYEIKKQKETEAKQLLDSINDYVLSELGILLHELKDEMCYVVTADEVKNNRCDAYYYQPKFEEVVEALENGTYNVVRFDVLIKDIKNGVEIRKYSEEGYRYLRVTDLGEFGINDINPRFVFIEKIPEKILLGNNSFLISRSGSLGLVSVVEEKIKNAILSSHIFKIDLDCSMILPKYLESYFRTTVGQIQFFRNNNGGIVPEINQSALRSLLILLPPIDIQNNIANEVKARMQKAEQLQKEAKEVLEEAKERVERIIIGEEEIEG